MLVWTVAALLTGAGLAAGEPPADAATSPGVKAGPAVAVDVQRLMETVGALPVKRSSTGDEADRAGLTRTEALLVERVRGLGYAPELEPIGKVKAGQPAPAWNNVVFELAGEGPMAREVILVGAHFDAVMGSPGADDDGSGVAALLEIARALRDRRHQRTIRFVLFNLEEAGLGGSRTHARRVREEAASGKAELVAMLSLEMLGYYSDQPGSQKNPFKKIPGSPQRDVGDFVALAAHSRDAALCSALAAAMAAAEPAVVTVRVDSFPNETIAMMPPDLLRSDHAPFIASGLPGVMVTDTANFRNPNYHKATDTPGTLNPAMLARTTRALAGAVDALAGPVGEPALGWRPAAPESK